jgi:hypothetical protein
VFAVVGVDEDALPGEQALAVVSGQEAAGEAARVAIGIGIEGGDRERPDLDVVEAFFHRREVDAVGGVDEVPRGAGGAAGHGGVGDRPDIPLAIDGVRADEQLAGLAMDHPVGGGAAEALGACGRFEAGVDFVEFVRGPVGAVGGVSDHPETIGPGDDRAGAAFVVVVEEREVGIDSGPGGRAGRRRGCPIRGGGGGGGSRIGSEEGEGEDEEEGGDEGEGPRLHSAWGGRVGEVRREGGGRWGHGG